MFWYFFPGGSGGKESICNAGDPGWEHLGREDPLEKEMAAHSSTLAWEIPWTEEPGMLQSMGLQRVGLDWTVSLSFHNCTVPVWPWVYLPMSSVSWLTSAAFYWVILIRAKRNMNFYAVQACFVDFLLCNPLNKKWWDRCCCPHFTD